MHRFFVASELLADLPGVPGTDPPGVPTRGTPTFLGTRTANVTTVSLPKNLAHQIRDVLRLAVGEHLLLLDNTGDEVLAAVAQSGRGGVEVRLLERRLGKSEATVRIVLCQGLLKSARFEWILEKGTELGVAIFAPTIYRRSMAGLEDAGPAKIQRWQRIIQEAAEQCGRSRLPELLPIRSLSQALDDIPANALALMPWEEVRGYSLREALSSMPPKPMTVMLFIGPEGGLTAEEVMLAQEHGVQVVTLGPLIMRSETAALAAVASVMYHQT